MILGESAHLGDAADIKISCLEIPTGALIWTYWTLISQLKLMVVIDRQRVVPDI